MAESSSNSPSQDISITVQSPGRSCLPIAFGISLVINLAAIVIFLLSFAQWFFGSDDADTGLPQIFHSGKADSKNKIAVLKFEGIILEGFLSHAARQIESIAKDDSIKAVVLRINSPGGTVTASEKLYRQIVELRDGTGRHTTRKIPIVVSMASIATSGGYYISAPAQQILAEPTTVTGSIGVFASFPNIEKFTKKHGIEMQVIKRGEVKTGGSPFRSMTPSEREVWADLIDDAYRRFVKVIEAGRPKLKGRMQEAIIDEIRLQEGSMDTQHFLSSTLSILSNPATNWPMWIVHRPKFFRYIRRRADGGIYTSAQALKFGLIDRIGTLDDAAEEAAQLSGIGSDYQVVTFKRPKSLVETMLGFQSPGSISIQRLQEGLTPRVWYLNAQSELAGILAVMRNRP